MASRQQIKRRIRSVTSTRQITKAMQLVAASKLRKAQEAALGPQEYSRVARGMLTTLRRLAENETNSPLFKQRTVKRRMLVIVTSDRTLAGAYNVNVIRRLIGELRSDKEAGIETEVIAIGRQGANAVARISGLNVAGAYIGLPERPEAKDLRPILTSVIDRFSEEELDEVSVVYTHFASTIKQQVQIRRLLPAGFEEEAMDDGAQQATVEPSVEALVESTTLRLLEVQLYQAILESNASEQSMRMIAMKNATDNANELIGDYTLEYNNARQAAITQELAEITGGAEAMS